MGHKPDKHNDPAERRSYIRLDHIFPVEFRFLDAAGEAVSGWYQAFTQDISRGGMCLTVNNIEFGDVKYLSDKDTTLALNINIPLGKDAVGAKARLAWFKTTRTEPVLQYALGVYYEVIDPSGNMRILKYARARKFFKGLAVTFSIFLSLGLVIAGFYSSRLRVENEKLLASLSVNLSHQKGLRQGGESLKGQIEDMKFLLSQSDRKIDMLSRRLREVSSDDQKTITTLQGSIDFFKKYQEKLKGDLTGLVEKKARVEDDVTAKVQEASLLEKKIRDKLYGWLAAHQNTNTGLVASFEGDRDINDWGFTYDEALAAMAFVKTGDIENARKIFDFYAAAKKSDTGGFFNAYYASTGDAAEYVAHAGPNIWLGLAVLQYTYHTQDRRYLKIAEDISRWLDTIRDPEGGLRGGKEFSWYSTEHNLDAYAFYDMFAELTKDEGYAGRAKQALDWLNKNAYSRISAPIVKRGKGDSTIATDTYAWSVTAIGPQALKDAGMDPDAIIEFAISNCSVSVDYRKPDGTPVRIKGFDFAKHQNLARGGVVSCEWSAQMILALKIMADYYRHSGNTEKADHYAGLAGEYISELSKMIITSPSPVGQGDFCLPYASQEFADTGHGWRTPKGNRTGSVAATAYAILAIDGFNPLRFNKP
ncbi:MAG TPA: hypothetical protein DCL35_01405 [Candidatus Omnitrophica bacterium]|nr:hypothetical protein [Candidatus Omnitrophota bacterium]